MYLFGERGLGTLRAVPFDMVDLSAFKYVKKNEDDKSARNKRHRISGNKESVTKKAKIDIPRDWPGPLPPILHPNLKIVFVGFNPGTESARLGHYYAHPSNRFWKYLFWSKITETLHTPFEDRRMPSKYQIGFCDLVARSTKGFTQLNKQEMLQGAHELDNRVASVCPNIVCFVGKGIWEAVARAFGWNIKDFRYGKDRKHKFGHGKSLLYCVASTSGLNSISTELQLEAWNELKQELSVLPLAPQADEIPLPENQ